MRALESCQPGLVVAMRRPGLAGNGGAWPLRRDSRRPCGTGSGAGQCCHARYGMGGRTARLVSEGGGPRGRGVAPPAAPAGGEKIRFRGCRKPSNRARALRFLRCRACLGGTRGGCRSLRLDRRLRRDRPAADTGGRCGHARANSARRSGQAAGRLPRRGDPRICVSAHARPARAALPCPRPLRGRDPLDVR